MWLWQQPHTVVHALHLDLKDLKSAETKAKEEAAIAERTEVCEDTEVKAGAAA